VARYNLFSTFTYNVNDNVSFFSELGYYNAESNGTTTSPAVSTTTTITFPPPATTTRSARRHFRTVSPIRTVCPASASPLPGVPVTINTYGLVDFGATPVTVNNEQFRILGGLKGKVAGFNWESAALFSQATVDDHSFAVSATKLQAAVSLTTAEAYNPFNGGNLSNPSYGDGTPSSASADRLDRRADSPREQDVPRAVGLQDQPARPLQDAGGPVGLAMGLEARHETYLDNRDSLIDGSQPATRTR
jgi:iron complex outermembrane receptor protein